MYQLIPSTLIVLASIAIAYRKTPNRSAAWLASITFLTLMLINGAFYGADYFTGNGIDESVVFHLRVGLGGSGFSEYLGLIMAGILYAALTMAGTFFLYRSIQSRKRSTSVPSIAVTVILIVVAFAVHPATQDLYVLSSSALADNRSNITQTDFPEEYLSGNVTIPDRKNVVYLYLEGVERTYLDENLFPGLMPNIRELENTATTFTDIRQVTHTGWTIAGIVASQCGIPLFSPSDGNSLSGLDEFLPQATCLGDILNENGYFLSYMGGADIAFAGKGNFYRSHGFDSVRGRNELAGELPDPGYLSGWGLYDDTLLSLLKEEYLDLSRSRAPFGLFALTLDTHHPDGHISKACEGLQYRDGSNPILNAVHCTDRLVKNFVDFIHDNPAPNGTTIVISSDHYALNNTASDILSSGERRNLALVIDDQEERAPGKIGKRGSMLDIAPTVLSFLGADVEGLAFGRNLLSDSPTLHEEKVSINGFLNENRSTVRYLWDYPQLDDGIQHYREEEDQLAFGDRRITMPAILILNDDGRVHEIIFSHSGQRDIGEYIAEMSATQDFLWADRCGVLEAFAGTGGAQRLQDAQWCITSGTAGAETVHLWEADNTYIGRDKVLDTLAGEEALSAANHRRRLDRLEDYIEYGVSPLATVSLSSDAQMTGSAFVRSSGYGAGESFIEKDGVQVHLVRGLTLVGLSDGRPPFRLRHVDSCEGMVTDTGALNSSGDFQSVLEDHSGAFDTFLIVGHDSVLCSGPDILETYMAGLDLHTWRDIGFRQPYIALLSPDGETEEWVGESEDSIAIEVKGFSPDPDPVTQRTLERIERVAHAGGGYEGMTYTNSLDALESNSDRYSHFEIDFSWTSDQELVCLHDWQDSFRRSFGMRTDSPLSLSDFQELVAERSDVEKCTLESLVDWMNDHPTKKIVTDIKEQNVSALRLIAERYPDLKDRFIPQVYQPDEYHAARMLGYDNVIWTLYQFGGDTDSVLAALEYMDLYALTMPVQRAEAGLAEAAYDRRGVLSYVHTINSEEQYRRYSALGIAEIYTDWLHPEQ